MTGKLFAKRVSVGRLLSSADGRALSVAARGLGAIATFAALRRTSAQSRLTREPRRTTQPNRSTGLAQLDGAPERRYYTGGDLSRAIAIADLRAKTHKLMPRFVLEYLDGGAEDEATMLRERTAYADWRFLPRTLVDGMPSVKNVIDFVPKDRRSFFESSAWIRDNQPTSMSWDTVAEMRSRWNKPFILKGILNLEDVRRALDWGVDGIVLSSHGGRQLDWSISPLDLVSAAREIVGDRMALYVAGGVRRGTDMLKAVALGADAVFAGRAPVYGLCAGGAAGAERALEILKREATDSMGLLGLSRVADLKPEMLTEVSGIRG